MANEFSEEMGKICKKAPEIINYLLGLEVEYWSRHARSSRPEFKLLLSNPSKYFNSYIRGKLKKNLS